MSITYQETTYSCGHTSRTMVRRDTEDVPDSFMPFYAMVKCPDCRKAMLSRIGRRCKHAEKRSALMKQLFSDID